MFVRGSHAVQLTGRGSVSAINCAFGPHSALFHLRGTSPDAAIRLEQCSALLENSAVAVGGFHVAGLGDLIKREADLDGTLAQVPEGEPVLLLSHNPDVFPRVPDRVALTISGHTHGAQVDIPVVREKTTPSRFTISGFAGYGNLSTSSPSFHIDSQFVYNFNFY